VCLHKCTCDGTEPVLAKNRYPFQGNENQKEYFAPPTASRPRPVAPASER
jgi:hypothetical protein